MLETLLETLSPSNYKNWINILVFACSNYTTNLTSNHSYSFNNKARDPTTSNNSNNDTTDVTSNNTRIIYKATASNDTTSYHTYNHATRSVIYNNDLLHHWYVLGLNNNKKYY